MKGAKLIVKAFKTKLYPNKKQIDILENIFGSCRFIYNNVLGQIQEFKFGYYEKDNSKPNIPSKFDMINLLPEIKEKYPFLKDFAPNPSLQASLKNLSKGFDGFYRGGGYPSFKSKNNKQSFTFDHTPTIKIIDNFVILPKNKEKIKFKLHKGKSIPTESKITSYTISKDSVGDYFISITYKIDIINKIENRNKAIGIDLGIKDLLITSDGDVVENDNLIRKYEKKLTKAQRKLSKKKKGSRNKNKQRIKVAKIHRKITRQREHRNHTISRALVNIYDFIALESLQVKNMIKNKRLSKAISNASWSTLVYMLEYKMTESQGQIVKIDKFYPSSKTCSCCGNVKEILLLSERTYICSECGLVMDRDLNAAKNILAEGLTELPLNKRKLYKIKSVESQVSPFYGTGLRSRKIYIN